LDIAFLAPEENDALLSQHNQETICDWGGGIKSIILHLFSCFDSDINLRIFIGGGSAAWYPAGSVMFWIFSVLFPCFF